MIKIISFVDSFKHFDEPIKEFQKRFGKNVDFVKLKPSKKKEEKAIIKEESQELEKILKKIKWFKVLLYINSKQLDSLEFAKMIDFKQAEFADIVFIIGWAYWVDYEKIKNYIDFKLSLSKMTFPHIQAIMMLYEQIYRSICIKKWTKYHH